jgi:glycopeptide antibiotics resistance protein
MARIDQELGLILLVGTAVVLIAAALTAWRVKAGAARMPAVWNSSLEAAVLGALAGIAVLTLGPFMSAGPGSANLIPFQSLFDSFHFGDFWVEIVLVDLAANFLLYLPLGLLVALRFPRLRVSLWAAVALGLTAGIELVQGIVLNRSADITDVVMNAAGAIAGFLVGRSLQALVRRRSRVALRSN